MGECLSPARLRLLPQIIGRRSFTPVSGNRLLAATPEVKQALIEALTQVRLLDGYSRPICYSLAKMKLQQLEQKDFYYDKLCSSLEKSVLPKLPDGF